MKKILALLLVLAIALSLGACAGPEKYSSQTSGTVSAGNGTDSLGEELNNISLFIYNAQNEKIGKIEYDGFAVPINGGLVYSKDSPVEAEWEYHLYTFATGESVKLGSVQNCYMQPTLGVLLQEHLFFFVITSEKEGQVLRLMDLDLESHTMSERYSEAGDFYVNSMAGEGNRLLFGLVDGNETYVQEYNLSTNERKTLKSFSFDDIKGRGDAVRFVYTDGDTISLVVMDHTEDFVQLRVDVYDKEMNFLKSRDISGISERETELRQRVLNFVYTNDFVIYQNSSSTRFVGRATDAGLEKCMDTDILQKIAFDMVLTPSTKLVYRSNYETNDLYLIDTKTGSVKESSFFAENKNYVFSHIMRGTNGDLLIRMGGSDPSTGQKLPYRLYYVSESDLHFS